MAINWDYILDSMVTGLLVVLVAGLVGMLGWQAYWKLYAEFSSHAELLRAIGVATVVAIAALVGIGLIGHVSIRISKSIKMLWNRD